MAEGTHDLECFKETEGLPHSVEEESHAQRRGYQQVSNTPAAC